MTLQELLEHAIVNQWFTPSYTHPLRTYVKRYAQALGHDAKTCPPTIYHLPDDRVHEIIHRTADTQLLPRSVQACVNAIVKWLHRAVEEGCLEAPEGQLISWSRKGAIGRACWGRVKQGLFRDQDGHDIPMPSYGLMDWPLALAQEVTQYLIWCRADIARGRPAKIKKGENSTTRVVHSVGCVAGYAVQVKGMDKDTLQLRALCEPALLDDFAWWWLTRRRLSTDTPFMRLHDVKTIARYWLKDEPMAREIAQVMRALHQEAPPQRNEAKKATRWLSLAELDRISRSIHPFNERRLEESRLARRFHRHIKDPSSEPLPPSMRTPAEGGYGTVALTQYATGVEMSLIIRLLVHRPLRIMNIYNMRMKNLQPQPHGGYRLVFEKHELKNGKYLKYGGWNERFPTRLLPLLQEWLEVWRPRLLEIHARHDRCGHKHQDAADFVFLNTKGHPWEDVTLGESIRRITWVFTQDHAGGPVAWYPHLIRSTWPSEMLHAGLPPLTMARILGDSFKITQEHYARYEREPPSPFAKQLAQEIEQGID